MKRIVTWIILFLFPFVLKAQTWNYTDTIVVTKTVSGKPTLYPITCNMWIDPSITKVRGIILVTKLLCEQSFVTSAPTRKVAKEEQLAIIKIEDNYFAQFND